MFATLHCTFSEGAGGMGDPSRGHQEHVDERHHGTEVSILCKSVNTFEMK